MPKIPESSAFDLELAAAQDPATIRLALASASLRGVALDNPPPFPLPTLAGEAGADHIRATLPTSEESYIGKEHFFHYGSDFGRTTLGAMYHALIDPSYRFMPVKPADLGLRVVSREEAGIPPVRSTGAPGSYSDAAKIADEVVIQAHGLITLSKDTATLSKVGQRAEPSHVVRFGPKRMQILRVITLGIDRQIELTGQK